MGAFLQRRGPREDTKHALKSRGVQGLGPPSPSAGGAVLSALGSHESDRGVQYHSTGPCQTAISHGSDGDVRNRMRTMVTYSIMQRGGIRPRGQT